MPILISMSKIIDAFNSINILQLFGIYALTLIVYILFLMVGLNTVNGQNRKFIDVFLTAFFSWLFGLIPIFGCIAGWYIINARHDTGFGNAIIAWLIMIIIPVIIVVMFFIATGVWATLWGT